MDKTKMIPVCVYDFEAGFSERSMNDDCIIDLNFPEWIVKKFYNTLVKQEYKETFNDWYSSIYTADDTIGLCEFAKKYGFTPESKVVVQVQFDMVIDRNKYDEDMETKIKELLEKGGYNVVGIDCVKSWETNEYGL